MTKKRLNTGQKTLAYLRIVLFVLLPQTTFGLWGIPVRVVRVLKYFMIMANTFGADLRALQRKTATVSSKFGTLYSCSTTVKATAQCCLYLSNLLIREWALSVFLLFCRACIQTTKSIYSKA